MFIKTKFNGYNRHNEQTASGLFLILMQPKSDYQWVDGRYIDVNSNSPIKAIVRHTTLSQFGNFMMGSARIHGRSITLSGGYGHDGLPVSVPKELYDSYGVELPTPLYDAWNHGNGWNGVGNEAPQMQRWALENLAALRK